MNTFTPCFPPVILEKCLDLAKYLAEKKTGKATLHINLGTSRFDFSVDHASDLQTGSPSLVIPKKLRKKSPSDRKRSFLRREKFLEEKRNASPPVDSPLSDNPNTSAEISQEPVIEESPLVTNNSEDMDIVEENVPVNSPRNDTETKDDLQNLSPPAHSPISPANPPLKDDTFEEIRILLCSKNKSTATRLAKHFPRAQFMDSHPTSKNHHFFFKVQINSSNLTKFKNDIHEFNDEMNLIMIRVLSEKKNYRPEEQNHCRECDHRHHI